MTRIRNIVQKKFTLNEQYKYAEQGAKDRANYTIFLFYAKRQGFGSGSGSAWIRINLSCWIRIRIRTQIADPDPDPGGQK